MPIQLPVTDLRPGMRLVRPLIAGRKLLLPEGKIVNNADVSLLTRRHPNLRATVADPILDNSIEFQDDRQEQAFAKYAREKFTETIFKAQDSLRAQASLGGMDFKAIEMAIGEIVSYLRENPSIWTLVVGDEGSESHLAEHTGRVFYVAMILGNAVRESIYRTHSRLRQLLRQPGAKPTLPLSPLGLAALLRDTSLWQLQQEVGYDKPLNEKQRELVMNHPHLSVELLPEDINPLTKEAIRHHHENYDGTGYPHMIAGDKIPLFARILRMADAYSAATVFRSGKAAKSSVRAMWEMTSGPYAHFYDPVVRKVFQSVVQPYPIGAKVRLSSGMYAVVVRHGHFHGLLPEVIVAYDEMGKPLPEKFLIGPCPLDRHPELRIISFAGDDLTDVYGDTPVYGDLEPEAAGFETILDGFYP